MTLQNGLSSAHITFIDEAGAAECERRGWLIRDGIQYHWFNRGYASFDDFLGALSSRKRKAIRKERAAAREGLRIRERCAAPRSARPNGMRCGISTRTPAARKWGHPYLTREFFDLIGERMGDQLLLFLAYRDGAADRRRAQLHRAGHALRPLLGMHRGGAVPPLRALLLSGDRMGDRARARLRPGRRAGRAQARARL